MQHNRPNGVLLFPALNRCHQVVRQALGHTGDYKGVDPDLTLTITQLKLKLMIT